MSSLHLDLNPGSLVEVLCFKHWTTAAASLFIVFKVIYLKVKKSRLGNGKHGAGEIFRGVSCKLGSRDDSSNGDISLTT